MNRFFKKLNQPFSYLALLSLLLISCDSLQSSSQQPSETPVAEKSGITIGTDMNIAMLQPISDAYTELSGVEIHWVAITPSELAQLKEEKTTTAMDFTLPEATDIGSVSSSANDTSSLSHHHSDNTSLTSRSIIDMSERQSIQTSTGWQDLDMLLMHSAFSLATASQLKLLQPVGSNILMQSVPEQYQDPDGDWFGLTTYARTIVFNKNKVNAPELHNYAGLAAPKWSGRLCMTALDRPENQAIAKMMMSFRGRENAEDFATSWQRNMGTPSRSDEDIISDIERGRCDVGVIDSDVFWRHAKANPTTPVRLMWTNQINRGAITNSITAGVTKSGHHSGQALAFMEWMLSAQGQALLAFHTSTFPLIPIKDTRVNMAAIRPEWTQFEADSRHLAAVIADERTILPLNALQEEDTE